MKLNRLHRVPLDLAPRLRLAPVEHLGLYNAFHRSSLVKRIHEVTVPMVLMGGMIACAYLPLLPGAHIAHLGTLIVLLLFPVLAAIDRLGASLVAAGLLPMAYLAGWIVDTYPATWVLAINALIHGVTWFVTVIIGHRHCEPWVRTGASVEDSNVYFRRGYYLARAVGRPTTWLDTLAQFNLAPLAALNGLLFDCGLRQQLAARVEREAEAVLDRLHRGHSPFSGESPCP